MASVLFAYFKSPRVQISALVYFLIAGILSQIPLFNYLGYEFSAVMTLPAAIISGTLTIQFLKEHQKNPLTRRTWLFIILDYIVVNQLLLLIPLLAISLNGLVVKNCDFPKGLIYYLLLPSITVVFSISLSLVIGTLFRYSLTIFYASVAALLFHIVVITYTQPQLFAYNFILGFFPGITYDETMTNVSSLILYRQFTVIASLMLISFFFILIARFDQNIRLKQNISVLVKNVKKERVFWGIITLCLAILMVGHLFRNVLGFEYSSADIQQELGRRTESSHFIFYYHEGNYTPIEIRRIKAESEYHYQKASGVLNSSELTGKKIEVFLYPNGEWKQRYIGTTNTNIAKPWKREIHLTVPTFSATFRHELVHILASEFGFPVIHASTRMALNEGLAVAVDWDEGIFTPHQYAAAIQREKGLENIDRLFSMTGFATQSSSFAYLISGSFTRYLIDRFGVDRFRFVFPNGRFMSSFGESLESLVKDWKVFLKTIDASEIPSETVSALFYQPSIFYKTCARKVAAQNQKALTALRAKNFHDAEIEFMASYENAPTSFALRGIFQSLNSQNRPMEVIRTYNTLPSTSSLKSHPGIRLLLGDAYYLAQKIDSAQQNYKHIRALNYTDSYIEASSFRLQCIHDRIDAKTFYTIYYSGSNDSATLRYLNDIRSISDSSYSLVSFLAFHTNSSSPLRMQFFESLISFKASADMKYYSLSQYADQLYSANRFEEAKVQYWQAKNYAPTAVLEDILDERIAICDFVQMEFL